MNKIAVGIDIGTFQIKVVVAEMNSVTSAMPKIIGVGYAESKGLRHGYIINQTDAIRSIRKATHQAEKSAGIKIERAYISVGGIGLSSVSSSGSVMISRADNEITELDVEKVSKESQDNIPKNIIQNQQIIHPIPLRYKVDGKEIFGRSPIGMKGVKLELENLYITCLSHHLQELIKAVESAGIEIADVMAAPLAAGIVALSKTEKIAGCVLANIGSETVSIVVYEDDIPISIEVFPIGSNDITNDIALGLKVSLDKAEKFKKKKGDEYDDDVPTKKLDEIIVARLSDIFELIDAHLKKIDKSGLLPAGIIITGGGSSIFDIEDLARASLNLPSKVVNITGEPGDDNRGGFKIKDATWSVAYGLCVLGLHADDEGSISSRLGRQIFKSISRKVSGFFRKFLP